MSTPHNHHVLQANPAPVSQTMATPWEMQDDWLGRTITVSRDGFYRVFDQHTDEQQGRLSYTVNPDTHELIWSHHHCALHSLQMHGAISTDRFGNETYTITVWEYNMHEHYHQYANAKFAAFVAWQNAQVTS